LLQDSNIKVAVLCGNERQPCKSLEVLKQNDNISEIIPLMTCSDLYNRKNDAHLMLVCEKNILNILLKSVTKGKLNAFVLDPQAPIEMAQMFLRILKREKNSLQLLAPTILMMAPMLDETEAWRRNWLDRFRHDVIEEMPIYRAEVFFNSSLSSFEMGLISSGDEDFTKHLVDVMSSIENKTGLVSDLRKIQGGVPKFHEVYEHIKFPPDAYDQSDILKQWNSQQPVAFQALFQLEGSVKTSRSRVKAAFENAVLNSFSSKIHEYKDVGDGSLFVSLNANRTAIVLWDGDRHIDVNIFDSSHKKIFAKKFSEKFKFKIPKYEVALLDEQPRGFGRVVNFFEDIEPRSDPFWA